MVLRLISFNSLIVPPPVPPAPHSRVPPSSGPTSLQQMHGDGHCSHQLKMAGGGGARGRVYCFWTPSTGADLSS